MRPDAGNPETGILGALIRSWIEGLAQILESMTDERPGIQWTAAALPEDAGSMLWWEQRFRLPQRPAVWIGAPEATWSELGTRTLQAAGIERVEAGDARNTWLEIISQSLAMLARDAAGLLHCDVACETGQEGRPREDFSLVAQVEIDCGSGKLLTAWLAFHPAWSGTLEAQADSPEAECEALSPQGGQKSGRAMDLLLDVELPVSISFGRAEMPMKDVLKLTTGSIVELSRTISEPVEVVVNNRVIARGEVVVVDGNYGVRIQEILSRNDRMRGLR